MRKMVRSAILWVILDVFVLVYSQSQFLGSIEFCADLKQRTNLTIPKITGTWFGIDVITHRETGFGENLSSDCIFVVIDEINHDVREKINDSRIFFINYFG